MEEKKVLVIAYYFPPMGLSGVQRTLKFVKYLPKYGWRPIVLTTSSAHFYAFDETLQKDLPEEEFRIYRTEKKATGFRRDNKYKIKKFPAYFTQKIGRAVLQTLYQPDSRKPWLKHAVKKGCEIIEENDIDLIFATAPPFTDFLVADELSQKYGIPFVIDYRDVWIDNPFHFYATPFHKMYSSKLEAKVLTNAAKAVVTVRNTKELLLKRYGFLSHNDVEIVTHGFDPEDFENVENVKEDNSKFVITHSGLFQDDRTPKYFLKAVSEFFKEKPEVKKNFELRFVGIMRKSHIRMLKKYGLIDNTVLCGYVKHNVVIKHLQESDVLWFMLKDDVRSPGKLYEYFAAGKTILACLPDGSVKKQLEESGTAYITQPDNVSAIRDGISTLYDFWKADNLLYPKSSFVEQFDRKYLTGELAKIFELAVEIK